VATLIRLIFCLIPVCHCQSQVEFVQCIVSSTSNALNKLMSEKVLSSAVAGSSRSYSFDQVLKHELLRIFGLEQEFVPYAVPVQWK